MPAGSKVRGRGWAASVERFAVRGRDGPAPSQVPGAAGPGAPRAPGWPSAWGWRGARPGDGRGVAGCFLLPALRKAPGLWGPSRKNGELTPPRGEPLPRPDRPSPGQDDDARSRPGRGSPRSARQGAGAVSLRPGLPLPTSRHGPGAHTRPWLPPPTRARGSRPPPFPSLTQRLPPRQLGSLPSFLLRVASASRSSAHRAGALRPRPSGSRLAPPPPRARAAPGPLPLPANGAGDAGPAPPPALPSVASVGTREVSRHRRKQNKWTKAFPAVRVVRPFPPACSV